VFEALCAATPDCSRIGGCCIGRRLDSKSRMSGDAHVRFRERLGVRFPRATRLVVLCRRREEAEAALSDIRDWVEENGLHPDKTHVGDCRQAGEGFEFLGYRFEAGRRWVRKKSLVRLKDAIRAKTRRTRGASLGQVIGDLNPTLRGWFGYFKQAQPSTFTMLDGFVR